MKPEYVSYSYISKTRTSNETIKNVIFNDPATIIFWNDGTKTVVKCEEGETYDPEKGMAMAIAKKFFGNKGKYYNVFKKWLPEDEKLNPFLSLKEACRNMSRNFVSGVSVTIEKKEEDKRMIKITGNASEKEAKAYVEYLEEKYGRKLKRLDIQIDGDYADLKYEFEYVPFERIRRITGYLTGDLNTWNDAKRAEERDRTKHL